MRTLNCGPYTVNLFAEDNSQTVVYAVMDREEAQLDIASVSRVIAGYSLAGLFALWSVFQTDIFDRVVSVSGSLWFDGFTDYMRSATPPDGLWRIYLSLGDREKNARNRRIAAVEDCTRQAAEFLRAWNIPVVFEMNQGGHFQDIPDRLARGISQLMGSNL